MRKIKKGIVTIVNGKDILSRRALAGLTGASLLTVGPTLWASVFPSDVVLLFALLFQFSFPLFSPLKPGDQFSPHYSFLDPGGT